MGAWCKLGKLGMLAVSRVKDLLFRGYGWNWFSGCGKEGSAVGTIYSVVGLFIRYIVVVKWVR